MKQYNLDALADGIFAIVMTLLVFEIRVPELGHYISNEILWREIVRLSPLFLSYLLSFSLLFTYWRSHHLIASAYAKNIDFTLTNMSAVFFFFVALVPFSSHLLGTYSTMHTAILVFAANIIAIGITLFFMRRYVTLAKTIENMEISREESHRAYTRILFPVFCSIVAGIVCFYDTRLALFLFTIGIIFNLSKTSTHIIFGVINRLTGKRLG